ncbi:ornithine cyclodeaminase family protein [Nesterenkonia natronophila]|uniref:Ornithine cyclodeaminase family protein n=1 Tax=Nesterenkonia natronophila TaxID=2174932 RepID=A0A3A4F5H0_9MICC|nr:ornithine cyclodeaminase family protein [Nesterenkonia natronophila]RJN32986.1 ornithine cyclodeaminase family protein [Nesterenkonia natronophila]
MNSELNIPPAQEKDSPPPHWIGGQQVNALLSMEEAVDVLEQTLKDGFDPEQDGSRTRHTTPHGQLLQMPSATNQWCGTKLITLRPGNEDAGLPVIQGVYVLFEGDSLSPVAILDGASLTALRTPAVTALAVRHLTSRASGRLVLFGTGVQALPHIRAVSTVFSPDHVDIVGRTPDRVETLVRQVQNLGISASAGDSQSVAEADVILCCTSASTPLFDGDLVQNHAVVAAIGSHDPDSREVDASLVRRSACVIESLQSAQAEAGDLIMAVEEGAFSWKDAVALRDLVAGDAELPSDRPKLFKGTGMPWQDLAVVSSIYLKDRG